MQPKGAGAGQESILALAFLLSQLVAFLLASVTEPQDSPQRLYFLHPQNALCLMHIPGVLEGGYWTLRMHHCTKYGTVWSPRSHSAGVTKMPITSYHFPVHLSVFIVHLFQLESKFLGHEEVSFFTIKSL